MRVNAYRLIGIYYKKPKQLIDTFENHSLGLIDWQSHANQELILQTPHQQWFISLEIISHNTNTASSIKFWHVIEYCLLPISQTIKGSQVSQETLDQFVSQKAEHLFSVQFCKIGVACQTSKVLYHGVLSQKSKFQQYFGLMVLINCQRQKKIYVKKLSHLKLSLKVK